MAVTIDPIDLSKALIRCASVTPTDHGALDVLQNTLEDLGFTCTRMPFSDTGTPDVDNLYARIGTAAPNLCFAGHTDVVPPGDTGAWSADPFDAVERDGNLIGRGAADMKCAIACFVAAASEFLDARGTDFGGSISFLITGDEEGPAINGTVKMLAQLADSGETLDGCIVGEPTNTSVLGEMAKIGRRGSLNGHLTVYGTQGHSAYPDLALNPIPPLMHMLQSINDTPLDAGTEHFQPSTVAITSIDVGNAATNVIPNVAEARFNIRFNDLHSSDSLEALIRERFDAAAADAGGIRYGLVISVSGESFLTPPGRLSDILVRAVEGVTGRVPALSTTGGTSDARFIKSVCPVVEFGMMNETAHKIDERVPVQALPQLTAIYRAVLEDWFSA